MACGMRQDADRCENPTILYILSPLIAATVRKIVSLYFGQTLFRVLSFVHKGALPRAKNRANNRAFWFSPSCSSPLSRNIGLDRAFWCKNRALRAKKNVV